jgi:hypothetical protein
MNLKSLLTGLVLVLYFVVLTVANSYALTNQSASKVRLLLDGKPLDVSKTYSLFELKGAFQIQVDGKEAAYAYLVVHRNQTPVKSKKLEGTSELSGFQLYAWLKGPNVSEEERLKRKGWLAIKTNTGPVTNSVFWLFGRVARKV